MKHKGKQSILDKAYPSLEDLLTVMNGLKPARMFYKQAKVVKDGNFESIDPFTEKGYREYRKLVYVLQGAATLTGVGKDVVSKMVDLLDRIADGEEV